MANYRLSKEDWTWIEVFAKILEVCSVCILIVSAITYSISVYRYLIHFSKSYQVR